MLSSMFAKKTCQITHIQYWNPANSSLCYRVPYMQYLMNGLICVFVLGLHTPILYHTSSRLFQLSNIFRFSPMHSLQSLKKKQHMLDVIFSQQTLKPFDNSILESEYKCKLLLRYKGRALKLQ